MSARAEDLFDGRDGSLGDVLHACVLHGGAHGLRMISSSATAVSRIVRRKPEHFDGVFGARREPGRELRPPLVDGRRR